MKTGLLGVVVTAAALLVACDSSAFTPPASPSTSPDVSPVAPPTPAPVATYLDIQPRVQQKVVAGSVLQFSAVVLDQGCGPLAQAATVWSLSSPSLGTIDQNGRFTAGAKATIGDVIASVAGAVTVQRSVSVAVIVGPFGGESGPLVVIPDPGPPCQPAPSPTIPTTPIPPGPSSPPAPNPLCGHEYITVGTSSFGSGAKIYIYGPGFNGYAGTGAATIYTVPGSYRVEVYFYNGNPGRVATVRLNPCNYLPLRW